MSSERARRVLGWEPVHSWRDTVDDAAASDTDGTG
jgi:nucleoside-diphosphate-sugar epimerase